MRANDSEAYGHVSAINDGITSGCVHAERSLLAALAADCHSPVAALAQADGRGGLRLDAELLDEDGTAHVIGSTTGGLHVPLGAALAADLLALAPAVVRRLFGG